MSVIVNLIAAKICRIPDKSLNGQAISLALAPFLGRYPKSIKGIKMEDIGGDFQDLTVQVEAIDMSQVQEMNACLNGELLVQAGFTSSNYIDAMARAALKSAERADPPPKQWWHWK